ncbi:MAG: hypothetical protein K2R98_18260 [Gemmataceae bacterium]|nr:hypothetical protein [Gemmataceae bacterium]
MHWSGWVAVVLGVIIGGWLTFDGTRAFLTGDYVTPRSGTNAGQLGPWSNLVAATGLDPRSPVMKAVHVILGVSWLAAVSCFATRVPLGWWAMAGCAVASLWYLPVGTLIAVVELVLLLLPTLRGGGSA